MESKLKLILYKVFTGTKCRVFLSKHVTIACDSAEKTVRAMKTCFHKPEGGFLHRCHRHNHALRCFLGFSFYFIEFTVWYAKQRIQEQR